jgi:hypothetical protein
LKKAVLVSIPLVEPFYPSAGLAAIAPIFKNNGYEVIISDVNVELHNQLNNDELENMHSWCELIVPLDANTETKILAVLEKNLQFWEEQQPDCIGVSVFTFHSITFAQMLLPMIRQRLPKCNIIVGGAGVSSSLKAITDYTTFGQQILDRRWADHVIFGEGEVSLDSLLTDKPHPGIDKNDPIQIENINQLLPPDYSDFDFTKYQDCRLLITGSRGCVRKCTFCDIETIWPKFRYRSPESQVAEMVAHAKEYNIKRFEFTDSLINGSVSGWIKFNDLLAEAKAKDSFLQDITYSGQFICRDRRDQPKIMYELMHYAGARQITVGIESFSEKIRNAMKKKFNDISIDYHLEQCGRWSIPNVFLMIVGHPEETQEDHAINVDRLHRYKIYSDMGTIFMIRWGYTMHIIKDTPLYRDQMYQIEDAHHTESDTLYSWINRDNPDLTLIERVRRRVELHETSFELGYSQPNSRGELKKILNLLDNYQAPPPKRSVYYLEPQKGI